MTGGNRRKSWRGHRLFSGTSSGGNLLVAPVELWAIFDRRSVNACSPGACALCFAPPANRRDLIKRLWESRRCSRFLDNYADPQRFIGGPVLSANTATFRPFDMRGPYQKLPDWTYKYASGHACVTLHDVPYLTGKRSGVEFWVPINAHLWRLRYAPRVGWNCAPWTENLVVMWPQGSKQTQTLTRGEYIREEMPFRVSRRARSFIYKKSCFYTENAKLIMRAIRAGIFNQPMCLDCLRDLTSRWYRRTDEIYRCYQRYPPHFGGLRYEKKLALFLDFLAERIAPLKNFR